MPVVNTNQREKNANKQKETINPVVIPMGRVLPPSMEVDRTRGKIGKMQGDKIKAKPSINANPLSTSDIVFHPYKR
jgi:hypothetical protein